MKNAKIYCLSTWFGMLLILLWMTSCKTQKPVTDKEVTTITTTETVHDTVFVTEKDSSALRALLECQNGKVVIKQVVEAKAGKHLNAPKANINDKNELTIDCEARAQEMFAQWKSKQVTRTTDKEKPVFVEHDLTDWEIIQIWFGRLCLIILALYILIKYLIF